MSRRVLHLISATRQGDADLAGLLDAALIGVRAAGGFAVAVGPWEDAKDRAASFDVALADSFPAPAGLPELAWRRIRRHWNDRGLEAIHCWGLQAERLARRALPHVPRVLTPLEPASKALSSRFPDTTTVVTLSDFDHQDWNATSRNAQRVPAPSFLSKVAPEAARRALGITSAEQVLCGICDVQDAERRTALTQTLLKLDVAAVPITALATPGAHARRSRRLEIESDVDSRLLPFRGTLPVALAAADVACWGPEHARSRSLGSFGARQILIGSALRSGVPVVMPDVGVDWNDLPRGSQDFATPDPTHTGVAHVLYRQLNTRERCTQASAGLRDDDRFAAQTRAFADAMTTIYEEVRRADPVRN